MNTEMKNIMEGLFQIDRKIWDFIEKIIMEDVVKKSNNLNKEDSKVKALDDKDEEIKMYREQIEYYRNEIDKLKDELNIKNKEQKHE